MTCHWRGDQSWLGAIARGGFAGGQRCALLEPHAVVAEIGEEAVAHLGGALDGLAVGMEPVAPFLGLGIGHPDDLGGAGQISLADAHGADLVVVGVGFLELAHLAAFQHQRLAPDGRQRAHDLEAVARGFQHEQVLGGGVLFGPAGELGHGHFVKYLFGQGLGRGLAPQQRGGEGVGVGVQADHPRI